jgi:phage shock protein PspC (stress-responsive transcriptional regulator)/predicted membrane protein
MAVRDRIAHHRCVNAVPPNVATPPPPGPPRTRPPLRRDRSRRVLGGVAAGVARSLGVHVTIVRIVFVVAAFAWIGIPAYIVAWIAIPPDDGSGEYTETEPRDIGMIVALGLIGLGALIFVQQIIPGSWHTGGRFIGPLLLIAGGVAILVLRRPGAHANTRADESQASEEPSDALTDAPSDEPIADAETVGADVPASAWTQTAPWATVQRERREQRRARRAQRPKPFITPITLSVLLIGAGVTFLLNAADVISVNLAVVFATGTLIVAAALLVSTWFGRAYGLIAVGVILALLTGAAATIDVPLRGGIGERIEQPATVSDVAATYQHGIGRLVIDLRNTQGLAGAERTITARLGIGQLEVIVPRGSVLSVQAHVGAGAIDVFDRQRHGWDVTYVVRAWTIDQLGIPSGTAIPPPNAPRLHLDLRVGAGHIRVAS